MSPPIATAKSPLRKRWLAFIALIVAALATAAAELGPAMPALHLPTALHTVFESLYIAGTAAISSVTWHSPHGQYRLRPTLIAALSIPGIVFGLLHMMTYAETSALLDQYSPALSFYSSRLSHLWLPFALCLLLSRRFSGTIPNAVRWSTVIATFGCIVPLAWAMLGHAADLPLLASPPGFLFRTALQCVVIAVSLLAAILATLHVESAGPMARSAAIAALLAGTGEACLLSPPDAAGALVILSHLLWILAVVAAFSAAYAEAIEIPYREIERSRETTEQERSRIESVFGAIVEGVIVVDTNLVMKAMNPVACHLAACGGQLLRGAPLAKALEAANSATAQAILEAVDTALRSGRTCHPHTSVAWQIAGHATVLEYSASPIRAKGKTLGAVLTLRDVTERSRLLDELRRGTEYARSLIEASPDPIIVIDPEGLVADVNFAVERLANLPRTHLIGCQFTHLFDKPELIDTALQTHLPHATVRDLCVVFAPENGPRTHVSCSIAPLSNTDGANTGAIAIARDISELRQIQLALEFQATCDPLTALPNRRIFREQIGSAMARAQRTGNLGAILIVDLDNFKDVNDALGHTVGDDLLKSVGTCIKFCLRETDLVARIGGDEFGVLVEHLARPEDVHFLTTKLLAAIASPQQLDGGEIAVTCSIGAAIYPGSSHDASSLLRNADTAMYRAKEAGRNNYQISTDDMNATVQRRVVLGNRLRHALDQSEFALHYQPQVNLANGAIIGAEALLRWYPSGLGSISPAEFIPIAEDSGFILPIGGWVVDEACRQAADWRRNLGIDIAVSVNLSARQFRDHDIVDTIKRSLAQTGLPPHLLGVELTESILVCEPQRVAQSLSTLKAIGVRISIDDFGTGYSSLSYLKRFPLDYLKIDRSFVSDVPGTRTDEAIVRSIIELAHSLQLDVIAEGVETEEQLHFLRTLGCDEVQGYYVSRPLPAPAFAAFAMQRIVSNVSAERRAVSPAS